MCGIAGVAFRDTGTVDRGVLARMIDAIRHRGPDSEGFHFGPGVGLAACRLSIIDLESGDQPIATENGKVTLVCNGEIYNAVELRERLERAGHRFRTGSDVEVILHLYEECGIDGVHQLRGMFAFALWDEETRCLFLVRDRFGIKPLYYASTEDALWFGSEQKAILATGEISREFGVHGLGDLVRLGFVVAPVTMLQGIRQVRPAAILRFCKGRVSETLYWTPSFPRRGEAEARMSRARWAETLLDKLDESVRLHLRSDVPVGAWLSPGVDSSAIAGLMHQHLPRPIQAVSLAYDDVRYDELRTQPTLDRFDGYDLRVTVPVARSQDIGLLPAALWHAEDPTASGIEVMRYVLGRATSEHRKVVLTGEGADEVFGGYSRFRTEKILHPVAGLPFWIRRAVALRLPHGLRRGGIERMLLAPPAMSLERYRYSLRGINRSAVTALLTPELRQRLDSEVDAWEPDMPPEFRHWSPFAQMQYIEMNTRLPSLTISTLDRATMAHSVEARVPFLDHELVEWASQIPPRMKLRGLQEKAVLRDAVSSILPPEIAFRKKRGLRAPLLGWMETELPPPLAHVLEPSVLRSAGIFDASRVTDLLEEHRSGRRNATYVLFTVLAIQVWHEVVLRGRGPLL